MERIDRVVERVQTEILEDIASGRVPSTVASFSELHDYIDANDYGGSDTYDLSLAEINEMQKQVDAWLKDGRQ